MAQYGSTDFLRPYTEVEHRVRAAGMVLGTDLIRIYLHGSLTLGCFRSERSAMDRRVIIEHRIELTVKRRSRGTA